MDVVKKPDQSELLNQLKSLAAGGIQIDRQQILNNMCSQFKDPYRWIVEYAANSYDAGASHCYIWGMRTESGITIFIEDNGHGMNRSRVMDFATLFRSVKKKELRKIIGQFGVGKISPAAVPGQCGFVMETSTGKESWRMTTGNLLSDEPIWLEEVKELSEPGTRFEITFKSEKPVKDELKKLSVCLEMYLRYLPMSIIVFDLACHDDSLKEAEVILKMHGSWNNQEGRFQGFYEMYGGSCKFDIAISVEKGVHEIYKNRVYISDQYNLIFHDLDQKANIPYLSVRVDSAGFETPFGRHKLSNEDILTSFSSHFRKKVLPGYLEKLFEAYENGYLDEYNISSMEIQDMVCALLGYDSSPTAVWSKVSIFMVYTSDRFQLLCLNELRRAVQNARVLYLENESTGRDYSVFDGPVLALKQPEGALKLLKKMFSKELRNLTEQDIVLEAKVENAPALSDLEKRFNGYLRFHPAVFAKNILIVGNKEPLLESYLLSENRQTSFLKETSRETEDASNQLAALRWTVNYLVTADGKKPCMTHRFIVKGDKVVLNLYHQEVKRLIKVAEKNASLAGHLALSMCLTGEKRVLPHLTPQMCEKLLAMDAIAKCGADTLSEFNEKKNQMLGLRSNHRRKFMRDASDIRTWLR
jgi:hypothetical protein